MTRAQNFAWGGYSSLSAHRSTLETQRIPLSCLVCTLQVARCGFIDADAVDERITSGVRDWQYTNSADRLHCNTMLHGWDNFFIMAGTAAATLIGLLFVVVTVGTGFSTSSIVHGTRGFLTPTLIRFCSVLFLSLGVLAPWPSARPIGIVLNLGGLAKTHGLVQFAKGREVDQDSG